MEEMMMLSADRRAELGRNGRELVLARFGIERILLEYDKTLMRLQAVGS
jgi:hypothetical protein